MTVIKSLRGLLALVLVAALSGCDKPAGKTADNAAEYPLDTQQKRVSYLLAQQEMDKWFNMGVALDPEAVSLAIRDRLAGKDVRLSEEEIKKTVETFQQDMLVKQQEMARQQQEMQAQLDAEFDKKAEENLKAGQAFLAENANKEGVVTLDSGLQYKVVTQGSGAVPGAADNVEVNYRGKLLNGDEFDSSYKRGVPASFGVNQVIPGWTEALQLMSEGSKWELYVPSDLGYGPGGYGNIGPNETLIFEIELIAIKEAEQSSEGEG